MHKFTFGLLGLVITLCVAPVLAFQEKDQTTEIKNVVNRLFDTMLKRDTEAMRSLFTPEGRMVLITTANGKPAVRSLAVDDFAKMVSAAKEPFRERMFDAEVRVEGELATVWGHYDFHVGERLSNCGASTVQLVRTPEGWKMIQFMSTIHTEGCERKD